MLLALLVALGATLCTALEFDRLDPYQLLDPGRLRGARIARGLTREQLGALLHVSYWAITAWEQGRDRPRADRMPRLAEVLGVRVNDLCREEASSGAS